MDKEKIICIFHKHFWKIIGICIGLLSSILILTIGIIKTIFISIFIYIGYFIGSKLDNKENLIEILDKILPLGKYKQ